MQDYKRILDQQRQFFATGKTLPIAFRLQQLKQLKTIIASHTTDIFAALQKDLRKATMESFISELLLVNKEIDFAIKNLKKWSRPERVPSPFPLLFPGRSAIHFEPYGCTLIIGPWNYPFQLVMLPLIGAISAGNCALIKPSECAPCTEHLLTTLINEHFPTDYIHAIKADPTEVEELLKQPFDYIFFTGSTQIGKLVMTAAAKNLTPITLELGGKSPCIIDASANLDFAAKRLAWGKLMNAGQTCIAPDYLLIENSCKDIFLSKLKMAIQTFYGTEPEKSPDYGRIINSKHFLRLSKLMQAGNIIVGGNTNEADLYIAPTLIDQVSWDDPIMQEEIFGPLLPILTFDNIDAVIQTLRMRPKPLALYLFTENKTVLNNVLNQLSFGGGCVNDCILQIANYHLPFGGVGPSGMGSYHGRYSFAAFSHRKSIYKKSWYLDFKLQYPPFSARKAWWLKQFLKL